MPWHTTGFFGAVALQGRYLSFFGRCLESAYVLQSRCSLFFSRDRSWTMVQLDHGTKSALVQGCCTKPAVVRNQPLYATPIASIMGWECKF